MTYNLIKIYNLLEEINKCKEILNSNPNAIEELVNIYSLVKENLHFFYNNGELSKYYGKVIGLIMSCEAKITKDFITESNPQFDYFEIDEIKTSLSEKEILDRIVLKTRKKLIQAYSSSNPNETIKKLSFTNDCYKASTIVEKICNDNDIKSRKIEIHPGFSKKHNLCNGNGFHYFNIVKINNNYYLIDCTYRQFFKIKGNFIEKIGIINMPGCLPGTFMLMKEKRRNVSNQLLKNGWIELNSEIIKTYFDGFAISYRNGIYYAKTNDYSYETSYTADDYIRFLRGEDNQIKHEGMDCLGYQRHLIKKI